jgi:tryptophan synthase alpha chain
MAGDPDLETTALILETLGDAGAGLIELGIPYGDPLADGPTIAAAGQRALARGTRIRDAFELVRRARSDGAPPIVLFTYLNPVLQYGVERFAADARRSGAAGVIVPDAALEETAELRTILTRHRASARPESQKHRPGLFTSSPGSV